MTKSKSTKIAGTAAWDIGSPHGGSADIPGSIELTEANVLLNTYAAHMVDQQPQDLRQAWKGQLGQVKINEHGFYALTGVDGRIVIEYRPESKTLRCLSMIHSFRSVVRPWVFRALQEAAAGGVSLNGTELCYDLVSKAVFVFEMFAESPVRKKDFINTCDRVMKTGERWMREHFLPAQNAFFARHAPPDTATARSEDVRATLVLAEDKAGFRDVWDRPTTARLPAIWTLDHVVAGEPAFAFVLFSGCVPDAAGLCSLMASLDILRPDGSSLMSAPDINIWNGPPPPVEHLQIAEQSLEISIDKKEPLGTYHIRGKVCNQGTQRCVEFSLPFELVKRTV